MALTVGLDISWNFHDKKIRKSVNFNRYFDVAFLSFEIYNIFTIVQSHTKKKKRRNSFYCQYRSAGIYFGAPLLMVNDVLSSVTTH